MKQFYSYFRDRDSKFTQGFTMKVTRIHYTGGLSQERFLENCGGRRKPTLLRVKALMTDQGPQIQSRTFGLVLESDNEDQAIKTVSAEDLAANRPLLTLVQGGVKTPKS